MRKAQKIVPSVTGAKELPGILPEWASAHAVHYQLLANQQLMLEDVHRTSKYHAGILGNLPDFAGKVVLDVGAGTGILSLFAAQAGARKVYAVEATSAADYARQLIAKAACGDRIEVLRGRLDAIDLDRCVDVIVSEPWGFFLVHERMIEVFLSARDRFLVDGGRMFPCTADLWLAPFRDSEIYDWRCERIAFWERSDYFGIDLTALADAARQELFSMPAVGAIAPDRILAAPVAKRLDFERMSQNELATVEVPFEFVMRAGGTVHGLAGWFDVHFAGSTKTVTLSTSPDVALTHWAQMRFLFDTPLVLEQGQTCSGTLTLTANAESSYDARIQCTAAAQERQQYYRLQSYFAWQDDE